jgi:hypothetical protein
VFCAVRWGAAVEKSVIAKATAVREQRRETAAFLRARSGKRSYMVRLRGRIMTCLRGLVITARRDYLFQGRRQLEICTVVVGEKLQ